MIEQLLHTAVEKALQSLYGAEGKVYSFKKREKILMETSHWLFSFLRASKKDLNKQQTS